MSTSAADRSNMDVFEDAIESQEDENHTGMMPATPPPPPIQFQFSPVPMLNTSPSTSNVTIDTTLLNERQPSIRAHEECGSIIKRMAVEVDRSAQLRSKVYELMDISKCHLQREKDRAKAAIEVVEKRAVERDGQWKKHLAESLSKTRVEMEKRIEDRDREWENRLESRLCEQAERHEISRVQMERMMKDSANTELG